MRLSFLLVLSLSSLLLGGCYVRLPVSHAVAVPVPRKEAAELDKREARDVPGRWFRVDVTISRETLRKTIQWELYTHILVEDCRTGGLVGIASSVGIEGTEGNFERARQRLDADQRRETFVISEPVFFQAGHPFDGLCVRLDGGSYTLQKISSEPVPLRVRTSDTQRRLSQPLNT
jgi:hypothetical protein